MTAPVRLQLSRKKGFNLQSHSQEINGRDAVNVARPSKWGNRFVVGQQYFDGQCMVTLTHEHAVHMYTVTKLREKNFSSEVFKELRGKNLACWCAPDQSCHADILLQFANQFLDDVA